MKIAIGNDHVAVDMKKEIQEYLESKGIEVINVPTVGCSAYSDAISRGAGFITLNENDPENYTYQTLYHFDMALEEGSLLPSIEGRDSTFYYKLVKFFRQKILDGFHNLFL